MKIKIIIKLKYLINSLTARNALVGFLIFSATFIASGSIPLNVEIANAAISKQLNFQGKLTVNSNGTNVVDGQYTFQFKLYDAATAGTLLWTETYDQGSGACEELQVTNGVFNAKLGSCNSLAAVDFSGGNLYLTVNFDSGSGYDGEMSPRKQLVASAFAFVANSVSGDGPVNTTNSSTTALTVAKAGTDYALQVDTSVASAVTGLKVTSAASGGGVALAAISSAANENLTLDAKGAGTLSLGATSTGNILLGGGSASTGCTVTNATGGFACTAGGSFTTLGLAGAITGATGFNGLVVTANTGVVTTGTWQGTAVGDDYGGTGQSTYTQGDTLYASAANTLSKLAIGGTGTCLTSNGTVPSWGACASSLSQLTDATATNTIDNDNFNQTWNWNSLTNQTAFTLGSTSATSGTLLNLNQSTSAFTGNGLLMNMANGSGSFTGNFADFQVNGTSRFKVGSGTVTTSGASAVAGVLQDVVLTNGTASGFQFGNRLLNTVNGGTAGTHVGQFIRMTDSTSLSSGQVVRGLEVQAYSGTNNNGINTGIATYGKTFGIQAESSGQAGAVSQPAAVFAYLNNGSNATVGNAIRAYSNTLTSADLVSFYHETSSFSGDGLIMNFGNNSGSFSGDFLNLQVAGSTRFSVSSAGIVNLNLNATATTNGLCHSGADVDAATNTQRDVVACSAAPGDIAEWYETEVGIEAADVVSIGDNTFTYNEKDFSAFTGQETGSTSTHTIAILKKSVGSYDNRLLGVVSTSPYQTFGKAVRNAGGQNPQPVALKGRVLVKVTSENGNVQAGDYLTSSATEAGKAMKATRPGVVLGQAIASDNGSGKVMVFVQPFFYDPTIMVDADGNVMLQRNTASTTLVASTETAAAYIIDQQGSGDILHLQQNGTDRLLVKNNGTVNINTEPVSAQDLVLEVKADDNAVFSINARGDAFISGVLVIKDDTFAGSIATLEDGTAEIEFSNHLGTGKPVIQLTAESEFPVVAQIIEFKKDNKNRYTGFVIKAFSLNGETVSSVVHYTAFAKQSGYETFGEVVLVVDNSSSSIEIESSGNGNDENIIEEVEESPPEDNPVQEETETVSDAGGGDGS